MGYIPLSGCAASPFSHASRGKGDAASAAGRPLRGGPRPGCASFKGGAQRTKRRSSAKAGGFTLVELLVAIAVLALLAIVSWRGLDGMVRAQQITRERADAVLTLQTVLAQWGSDLDALQAVDQTQPIAWDGQVLRLTRRGMRLPDEGVTVVAWTLRNVDGSDSWLRWQSAPVRTRAEWTEAWARAAQWARSPGAAERQRETVLMPLAGWQLYYHRGGAWANAQSASTTGSMPQTPGGLSTVAASIPEGVRLQLTLPEGSALPGVMTRDWANPLLGGGKS